MSEPSLIVYDGECVFCQNYVRFLRLKNSIGSVDLVDARSGDARVEALWEAGYDLDEGMIFCHRGQVFYGSDAVHVLSGLTSPIGLLNRANAIIFSSKLATRFLYPAMKLGRRLTLAARGRTMLSEQRD